MIYLDELVTNFYDDDDPSKVAYILYMFMRYDYPEIWWCEWIQPCMTGNKIYAFSLSYSKGYDTVEKVTPYNDRIENETQNFIR